MLENIHEAYSFEKRISKLKRESNYYPSILIKEYPNDNPIYHKVIFASTLVRINRNDKWYIVHCVENIIPTKVVDREELLLKIMKSVHKIQHLYQITGLYEDVDSLQESEVERISKITTSQG